MYILQIKIKMPWVHNLHRYSFFAKNGAVSQRFYDTPRTGTITKLPDITSLQRGVTYTIMPDGHHMQVPANSRLEVRASAESHDDNEHKDMIQALQHILKGKKPIPGQPRINNQDKHTGSMFTRLCRFKQG